MVLGLDLLDTARLVNTEQVETQLIAAALSECEWADNHVSSPQGVKERLAQRLLSIQAELVEKASYGVGILASIGSTAPFIGLLGTVWGIMNSFVGIADAKNTSLAVVAPGIAEALLATAAGLLAAIPAVLFYNHFTRISVHYKKQLNAISSDLMILASRYLEVQPQPLVHKSIHKAC
jgi:biopolymer transport protein ExbB